MSALTLNAICSVHRDELNDPDGIVLNAGGLKLYIDMVDCNNGKHIAYEDSKKLVKPTLKHALLVLAYIDEVNKKLSEIGGKPLDGSFFTSHEKDGDVQVFGFQDGISYTYIVPKNSTALPCNYKVRQIKQL